MCAMGKIIGLHYSNKHQLRINLPANGSVLLTNLYFLNCWHLVEIIFSIETVFDLSAERGVVLWELDVSEVQKVLRKRGVRLKGWIHEAEIQRKLH